MDGPHSSYSCLEIHICWKVEREARMEPPIQTEYFLSGGVAGILGLSTLYGFAFYAVSVVVLWLMILWKAGSEWKKYFGSRQALLTNGFFGQMFTYVLFWTFLYGMVHVY